MVQSAEGAVGGGRSGWQLRDGFAVAEGTMVDAVASIFEGAVGVKGGSATLPGAVGIPNPQGC